MHSFHDPDLADLPLFSWSEERYLVHPKTGAKLPRRGKVNTACEIMDGCDRHVLYTLIESGEIAAYKRRPNSPNSPWIVDLLSVWHHKKSQERLRRAF